MTKYLVTYHVGDGFTFACASFEICDTLQEALDRALELEAEGCEPVEIYPIGERIV